MPPPIGPKPAPATPPPASATPLPASTTPASAGSAASASGSAGTAAVAAPAVPPPATASPAPMPPLQQPQAPVIVVKPFLAMTVFGPAPKGSPGVGPRRTPSAAEERVNAAIREAMSQPRVEPKPDGGLKLPAAFSVFGRNPVGDTTVSFGISGKLEADMTPRAVTAAVGGSIPGIGGIGLNKTMPDPPLEPSSPVEVKREEPAPPAPPAKK